jgi:putative Holliday junction resolvase
VPPGRVLGVDVGAVRVGVALSDPAGTLATPLVTLDRDETTWSDLDRLVELVTEHEVVEVVVGLPRTLAGREGPAAQGARAYVEDLREVLAEHSMTDLPITLADERLTTVTATRMLSDRGVRGRAQRRVIDQAAAVEILQTWLDARRRADSDHPDRRDGAAP